ncbi:hypothetical protein PLICRDRAFT_114320 [Plicaturopsis crispa FD-325 SS-3]|nr:hypothetical protein PLICRDRAFT_114320 [Plicaturopsis crispa FD-325 SS-3]
MSGYKSFAIFGAGNVATPVIEALTATPGTSVLVVLRTGGTPRPIPPGAKAATVDYTDSAALTSLLLTHAIQVVVSLVGNGGLQWQKELARAAKDAGTVRLFVPSEFGMPSEGQTAAYVGRKGDVIEYLREIELPYARYYTGLWSEFLEYAVATKETGKYNIVGKGETPFTTTSLLDVGGFVAYTLTHLPPAQLHNATFHIQGTRTTLREAAKLFGGRYPVVHVDAIPGGVGDEISGAVGGVGNTKARTALQVLIEQGAVSTAWVPAEGREGAEKGDSANALWEGHVWKDLGSVLGV